MLRVNIKELSTQVFQSSLLVFIFGCCCIIAAYQVPWYFTFFSNKDFTQNNPYCMLFFLWVNFILFGLLPALYIRFVLNKPLSDYGIRTPIINKKIICIWLLTIGLSATSVYYLAQQPSIKNYYDQSQSLPWQEFIFMQLTALPIYYIFEEFFFRGFLFLSLWRKLGWHGFWICEVIFAVAHFLKPGLEILFAIPVGIVLNLLTLWTRSIAPAWALHLSIGFLLNILIYFHWV